MSACQETFATDSYGLPISRRRSAKRAFC